MVVVIKSTVWYSTKVSSTLFSTLYISGAGQAFSINFMYSVLTIFLKS